ncbi:hypothetical protein D9M68_711710 [compost metagenome]
MDAGNRAGDCGNALLGKHRNQRVGILRVERFDGMRYRIQTRRDCHLRRKGEGKIHVIDDDFRQHFQGPLRGLDALFSLAEDRRGFRPCVSGRDGDLWQVGVQCDGLAQADCRPTAERDDAVSVHEPDMLDGPRSNFDRSVHGGISERAN